MMHVYLGKLYPDMAKAMILFCIPVDNIVRNDD